MNFNKLINHYTSFNLRKSWQIFDILRSRLNARVLWRFKEDYYWWTQNILINGSSISKWIKSFIEWPWRKFPTTITNNNICVGNLTEEGSWNSLETYVGNPRVRGTNRGNFSGTFFAFHTLEYWPKLFIHHLLDSMHIVKNVCKSSLKHLKQTWVHPTWRSLFGHLNPML